jgi:CheY-like chemotaxis protein
MKPQRPLGMLIVDDEPPLLRLAEIGLRQHGFAVWTAPDGEEALRVYRRHAAEIDLVLSDIQMPGMDGPRLLCELRKLNPVVRCCFMTGDSGRYSLAELLANGALQVFQKPFSVTDIADALRNLILSELSRQSSPSEK